ncbi:porin, partial [Accumulibacter sp.]
MQKKLIALAVASVASGAAFAQTNVTMYGIADAGYVYSTGKANIAGGGTNKFSGIESGLLSGSRLGFKGEEALGNGLKAIFQLEYGLSIDSNAGVGTALARQQFVGLSSNALG